VEDMASFAALERLYYCGYTCLQYTNAGEVAALQRRIVCVLLPEQHVARGPHAAHRKIFSGPEPIGSTLPGPLKKYP
jgi:hypothetical protein